MHKHNYNLTKQVQLPFMTVHNYYKCECGEEYDDYENPVGKFTLKKDENVL